MGPDHTPKKIAMPMTAASVAQRRMGFKALKSRANRQQSKHWLSERKWENLRKQYENKTLLIPDILMCKSQRATHRLPMRPLIAEMPRSLTQTGLTYICC